MSATGTTTVDFGASGADVVTAVVIGQAGISVGSYVEAWIMADSTADNDADAHVLGATTISLTCGNIVAGTGFTIYATDPAFNVTGLFSIRWVWV